MSSSRRAAALSLAMLLIACGSKESTPQQAAAEPEPGVGEVEHGAAPADASAAGIDAAAAAADPMAAEMAAYERARPVFEEHCSHCHAPPADGAKPSKKRAKALKHFSMGSYPFGGHHAGELGATVLKVLGATGAKPTMPRDDPGAVQGAELDAIKAWAAAYDAADAAGTGYHGKGDGKHHGGHGRGGGRDHGRRRH